MQLNESIIVVVVIVMTYIYMYMYIHYDGKLVVVI